MSNPIITVNAFIARLLVYGLKGLAEEIQNGASVGITDLCHFAIYDENGYGNEYIIESDNEVTTVYGRLVEPEGGTVWQFRDEPDYEVDVPENACEEAVRIVTAMLNTEMLAGKEGTGVPENYLDNTFAQRLPGGKGSIYEGHTAETLKSALIAAKYTQKEHVDIKSPCTGFVTYDIKGGEYGMIRIADQPEDSKFIIVDDKDTKKVSLMLVGAAGRIKTNETWVILGPAENGEEVLFTFHPGEPVPRATTSTEVLPVGTKLTKQEALAKGFNLAKVG